MTENKWRHVPYATLATIKSTFLDLVSLISIIKVNCPRCKEFNCPELFYLRDSTSLNQKYQLGFETLMNRALRFH